jgi:hypothetical protein
MIDSLTLVQNRLNLKLNIADTASMLLPYARVQQMLDSLALVQSRLDLKLQAVTPGTSGNVLTSDGTTWTSAAGGVPYTGATGPVNLGAYDLTLQGFTIGLGTGSIATNIALGRNALQSNTTGFENSAFGMQSLKNNTDGFVNTAFGAYSLSTNVIGARNTAFGKNALYTNKAYDNTALGYLTLQNNSTGSYNVAVGSESLVANTTASNNTAVGSMSLWTNTTGGGNTAIGYSSLIFNQTGANNIAAGYGALYSNTTASYNAAFGAQSLEQNTTGNSNTAIGVAAIDRNSTGANNAVLGAFAGRYIGDGATYNTEINNAVLIGANAKPLSDHGANEIVIGYNAVGNGSNTIQLGNTSVTNVKTSGTITAGTVTYPNVHNSTDGQVLTVDATGTASWSTVVIREVADELTATAAQTSFNLSQTKSVNSKVKMYINGIRISNAAYGVSGTTLTYDPVLNGGYSLTSGDRVQFDYYY